MTKSGPVVLQETQIGEDALRQWCAETERLTGAKIHITAQWVIHSDDPRVELAIAALFGMRDEPSRMRDQPSAPLPAERKTVRGKAITFGRGKKKPFALNPAPEKQVKSWQVFDGAGNPVERLTIEEKNRKLLTGSFPEGTILQHPKAGRQRVTGEPGSGQGMEPVKS